METRIRQLGIESQTTVRGIVQGRKRREREAETFDQALRESGVESARDGLDPEGVRSDALPPEEGTGGRLDVVA